MRMPSRLRSSAEERRKRLPRSVTNLALADWAPGGRCSRSAPFRACLSRLTDILCQQWSERRDLNSGPLVPQTSALTRLRHAPPRRVYRRREEGAASIVYLAFRSGGRRL